MIEDRKGAVPELPALEAMDASASFVFYLAGSRYMGVARPDSDWDFMAQDTPAVREFLQGLGFKSKLAVEYDGDRLTNTVMELAEESAVLQVQLCKDVLLKRRVRDVIKDYLLEEHTKADKMERAVLWEALGNALSFKHVDFSFTGAF